ERGACTEEREPHSCTTRRELVVPRTPNGMPAVTTTRSPCLATPLLMRYSLAEASSDSNVSSPGLSTGWTPQTSARWRYVAGWLLTPRIGTGGRYLDTMLLVNPLRVKVTIATAPSRIVACIGRVELAGLAGVAPLRGLLTCTPWSWSHMPRSG